MCRQITCKKCHRPGWAGCGAHVEQVLGHVPPEQRCQCGAGAKATNKPETQSNWLQRLRQGKSSAKR